MKNVLMVLESDFPPDIRVENEIEYLHKNGFSVTVACYTRTNRQQYENLKHCKVVRKRIHPLIYKSSVGALKFNFYFRFWESFLNKVLSAEKFDLIHIHDLPLARIGVKMKSKFHLPLIVDLHENWPSLLEEAPYTKSLLGRFLSSNKQWRLYEKTELKKADAIITVVDEMRSRIIHLGIDSMKVSVVSNVLNISTFPNIEVDTDDGINLFYGGGLNYHRGVQIAIEGVAILKNKLPNLKLYIAGYGSYMPELQKLVADLKRNEMVEFLGKMNQVDLLAQMKKCNIALIPHLCSEQTNNSSPNKLFQYMYAEKPILSSNCNSLRRVIESNDIGVVYQHDSPIDFSQKLLDLISNNIDNKYGKNGKKAVENKYCWDVQQYVLVSIYEDALS